MSSSEGSGGGGDTGAGSAMSSVERGLEEALVELGCRLRSPPDADESLLELLDGDDSNAKKRSETANEVEKTLLSSVSEAKPAPKTKGNFSPEKDAIGRSTLKVGDNKSSERTVSDDLPEGSDHPTSEEKGSVLDDQNQDDLLSKDVNVKKEPEAKSAPKQKSNVKQTKGNFTLDKDATGESSLKVGDNKSSERTVSDDLPEGSDPTSEEKGSVLDDQNQDDLLSKDVNAKKEPEATGKKKCSEIAHEVERLLSSDPEAKSAPKQKSNVKQTKVNFTLDKDATGESSLKGDDSKAKKRSETANEVEKTLLSSDSEAKSAPKTEGNFSPEKDATGRLTLKGLWAHAPSELLDIVLEKLKVYPEWDTFGAVCQRWRDILLENKLHLTSVCNDRRVMLLRNYASDNLASENILQFRFQSEELPKIIGYSFGYLITTSKSSINLCDPLFGSLTSVQAETAPGCDLQKAILSSAATEESCILMGIVRSDTRRLAFCNVHKGEWKSLYNPTAGEGGYGYEDLTYHEGKCYFLTETGGVHMCELGDSPIIEVLTPKSRRSDDVYRRSIVPMGGNLIVVLRDCLPVSCDSSGGFSIEELDLAKLSWSTRSDLKGWQIYLGISSFALPPERQSKFGKPNSVYILQDEFEIERSENTELVYYYEGIVEPTVSLDRQEVFDVQTQSIPARRSALGSLQMFWFHSF